MADIDIRMSHKCINVCHDKIQQNIAVNLLLVNQTRTSILPISRTCVLDMFCVSELFQHNVVVVHFDFENTQ